MKRKIGMTAALVVALALTGYAQKTRLLRHVDAGRGGRRDRRRPAAVAAGVAAADR